MAGEGLPPKKIVYVPAIGPRLRKLLFVVFALFAVLAVNSAYLGTITWFEWQSGKTLQDYCPRCKRIMRALSYASLPQASERVFQGSRDTSERS